MEMGIGCLSDDSLGEGERKTKVGVVVLLPPFDEETLTYVCCSSLRPPDDACGGGGCEGISARGASGPNVFRRLVSLPVVVRADVDQLTLVVQDPFQTWRS